MNDRLSIIITMRYLEKHRIKYGAAFELAIADHKEDIQKNRDRPDRAAQLAFPIAATLLNLKRLLDRCNHSHK